MRGMSRQIESPIAKLGDRCLLCVEGTLVPSPSGLNLRCGRCKRITLVRQAHRLDGRTDPKRHSRFPRRPKEQF
jgi:hypothetical protein